MLVLRAERPVVADVGAAQQGRVDHRDELRVRAQVAEHLAARDARLAVGLLADLGVPRSTAGLAARLELSAPAVSQHLSALRGAGLVTSSRHGREVLYLRTELGERLLGAHG
jgi:DNA-binding transcriptional ArsR family regulator